MANKGTHLSKSSTAKTSPKKGSITRSGTGRGSIEITGSGAQRSSVRKQAGGAGRQSGASDLERMFGAALKSMDTNRAQLNALDGQNGNHGDNMAGNMRLITDALRANRGKPPADGLRAAAESLQQQGQGGTGQYYAQGLARAAEQFQGSDQLGQNDLLGLLQTLMGSVPAQGYPDAQAPAGGSLLETLLGGLAGGSGAPSPGTGGLLEGLLSVAGGSAPTQPGQSVGTGLDMGSLLNVGLSLLQQGQSGGDVTGTALQTLLGALGGGGGGARSYGSAREASGSLLMQSVLQALLGGR